MNNRIRDPLSIVVLQEHNERGGAERRQFTASVTNANPNVAELSAAVDQYKLRHHRRFITFEELYNVMMELGYHK